MRNRCGEGVVAHLHRNKGRGQRLFIYAPHFYSRYWSRGKGSKEGFDRCERMNIMTGNKIQVFIAEMSNIVDVKISNRRKSGSEELERGVDGSVKGRMLYNLIN